VPDLCTTGNVVALVLPGLTNASAAQNNTENEVMTSFLKDELLDILTLLLFKNFHETLSRIVAILKVISIVFYISRPTKKGAQRAPFC
jgi:hypothetical protein